MIYKSIVELIGNTPILEIDKKVHQIKNVNLFVKLEYYNPFGSLKDRMAWWMIKDNLEGIKKGKIIIESSSGNTAKALQILASIYGSSLKTVTNRIKNKEKKQILQLLGADINELPGKSQCYDPNDPNDPLVYINDEVNKNPDKYFYTNQYFNYKNVEAHYEGTGREILKDLNRVDYFFSGLGTTGSTKGVKKALKEKNNNTKIIGIVSSEDDVIPGIRNNQELFEVGLFDKNDYDDIVIINSQDAINGSLELIKKSGVLVGPTGGASYAAIKKYFNNKQLKENINVVFLACDRFEWYLDYYYQRRPDLFSEPIYKDSIKNFKINESLDIDMSAEELDRKIKEESDNLILVDIRSNIAYKFGYIQNSINIPEDYLENVIDRSMLFPKDKNIVFICPNGQRSRKYAQYLRQFNYQSYNLQGGILDWQKSQLKLEKMI